VRTAVSLLVSALLFALPELASAGPPKLSELPGGSRLELLGPLELRKSPVLGTPVPRLGRLFVASTIWHSVLQDGQLRLPADPGEDALPDRNKPWLEIWPKPDAIIPATGTYEGPIRFTIAEVSKEIAIDSAQGDRKYLHVSLVSSEESAPLNAISWYEPLSAHEPDLEELSGALGAPVRLLSADGKPMWDAAPSPGENELRAVGFVVSEYADVPVCSGSIIGDDFVLTADHCVGDLLARHPEGFYFCPGCASEEVTLEALFGPEFKPGPDAKLSFTAATRQKLWRVVRMPRPPEKLRIDVAILELERKQGQSAPLAALFGRLLLEAPGESARFSEDSLGALIGYPDWKRELQPRRWLHASDTELLLGHDCLGPRREALPGCRETRGGSSGSPLLRFSHGRFRIAAIHVASRLSGSGLAEPISSCYGWVRGVLDGAPRE
jgi:hypothetical protein